MKRKIFIPLITPLNNDLEVCEMSVNSLIQSSYNFASGYVPCLTSGEGWLLPDEHWRTMVSSCIKYAKDKTIIAGIERPLPDDVILLAQEAEGLGADAVMITTPFGKNITQEEMYEHFLKTHDSITIPIYIYNENSLSNNTIDHQTLLKITNLPRVIGIKESMNTDFNNTQVSQLKENGVSIYQGWENRIVNDSLSDGNICSLSNLFPDLCLQAAFAITNELTQEVDLLCKENGIYEESWYEHIKQKLYERGEISSDKILL